MKTEKVEHIKAHTKTTIIITCDRCGKGSSDIYMGIKPCLVCKEDVCWKCSVGYEWGYSLLAGGSCGDHPSYICNKCWENGEEIRKQIQAIRDNAEKDEDKLWEQWTAQQAMK